MTPCSYCGEDVARDGTTLEAELLIEDRTYAIKPSFCSWQHAASWFNQDPPDITHWTQLKKRTAPADGGLITWLIMGSLMAMLLAAVICLIVFLP